MKIMKKTDKSRWGLWFIVIVLVILIFIFKFLVKNESIVNFLLSLIGVVAMLAIALHNFSKIDESTKETVNAILESSKKQIEEFSRFIQEIKEINLGLSNLFKSLEIISKDIQTRQKQISYLTLTFGGNLDQIDLKSGEEHEIEFSIKNGGVLSATDPSWSICFPPEIKVIEAKGNDIVPQGRGTKYQGYTAVWVDQEKISAKASVSFKIKIKTESIKIGLFEIPYSCSAKDSLQNEDKLSINFIG